MVFFVQVSGGENTSSIVEMDTQMRHQEKVIRRLEQKKLS